MTNPKIKPAYEVRLGGVKAAIWCNTTEKSGTFYSVTFSRSYKRGDEWKRSDSYGRNELPLLKSVVEMAFEWIQSQSNAAEPATIDATSPNV